MAGVQGVHLVTDQVNRNHSAYNCDVRFQLVIPVKITATIG